jgi:DNA polymerase-3 subunit alpha
LPDVPPWTEAERLAREKEIVGFFITGHPLAKFRDELRVFGQVATANLKQFRDQRVELPCVVTAVSKQISRRNGAEWARITVEDFSGTATVLAFKDAWQEHKEALTQDAVVLLRGKVSARERDEDDPPIFLDGAEPLEAVPASGKLAIQIELEFREPPEAGSFQEAKEILTAHPGVAPVEILVQTGNGLGSPRLRSRSMKADPGPETLKALEKLFGASHVKLIRTLSEKTD